MKSIYSFKISPLTSISTKQRSIHSEICKFYGSTGLLYGGEGHAGLACSKNT
ncbi:hypothetical protein V6Z11_A12G099700 [Gossypium hirsutum]